MIGPVHPLRPFPVCFPFSPPFQAESLFLIPLWLLNAEYKLTPVLLPYGWAKAFFPVGNDVSGAINIIDL